MTSQKASFQRIGYFDTLRAIAIAAVVVLHVAALDWNAVAPATSSWQFLNVYDGAVRFCVPVFFMISGALFLNPEREISIRRLLGHNLFRIAVAFAFWSVLYAAARVYGGNGSGRITDFLANAVLGHYHLWFLIALAGLYLATPLLRAVVKNRLLAWYFVGLGIIFASILPLLTSVPWAGPILASFLDTMQLQLPLGYTIYFVLGYLLHTTPLSNVQTIWLAIMAIAGAGVTIVGTSALSLHASDGPVGLLYGYLSPNVLLTAVGIFGLVKRVQREESLEGPSHTPIVAVLSKYSFGIYLLHPAIQAGLQRLGLTAVEPFHPAVGVPLVSLIILGASALAVAAISRVPLARKYIV